MWYQYRIDKYLGTLLVSQTAWKALPPVIPKVAIEDGKLPELLLAYSCLSNHSEADRQQ